MSDMTTTAGRIAFQKKAAAHGIDIFLDDFAADGTLDGMEPDEWLEAMTLD